MKRGFLFFLLLFATLPLPALFKRFTGGFRLEKLQLDFPFHPEWETGSAVDPEIRAVLNQSFTYLDRGAQCYVFQSRDQKYVIKFFRYDKRKGIFRSFRRTFSKAQKKRNNFEEKIVRLFNGCKLAYERVPEETGLLFVHLNSTDRGLPILKCRDRFLRTYEIPLDRYRFALQKKAKPFSVTLNNALQSNDAGRMQAYLDSIFSLLTRRTLMQISNSDPNLCRNFGFLEERAIEIDFGNFNNCPSLKDPSNRLAEMKRYIRPLHRWLEKRAPLWADYVDEQMGNLRETQ